MLNVNLITLPTEGEWVSGVYPVFQCPILA